jgi:hypothetical protein
MHTFTDNAGRAWCIEVNVGAIKRVRDLAKVDLANFDAKSPDYVFAKLADPVALVDSLWVLCSDQANRIGVGQDAFAASLGGDALEAAHEAVLECLADFSPGPRRAAMRAMMKNMREAQVILLTRAMKTLDAPDAAERMADMLVRLAGTGSNSPTNSPASSASTPTPSPSASLT